MNGEVGFPKPIGKRALAFADYGAAEGWSSLTHEVIERSAQLLFGVTGRHHRHLSLNGLGEFLKGFVYLHRPTL